MYKIINNGNGEILGYVQELNYIRFKEESGCFVACGQDEAQGIAFNGEAYNLFPMKNFAEKGFVSIINIDGGTEIFEMQKIINQQNEYIATLEDALCELDGGIQE